MGCNTNKEHLLKEQIVLWVRRGKKRALIAVGHKILVAAYFILQDKVEYKELGREFLQDKNKKRRINRHLKLLKELGVDVEIKNYVA